MAINVSTLKPDSLKSKEVATEEYVDTGISNIDVSSSINSKQEQKYRSYLIDNNTNTPLIDAICLSIDCDKTYLLDKIIQKANAYASAIGALVGERQKQEKLILDGE